MRTKPTREYATFRDGVEDGKAKLSNTNRRIRVIEALLRNTLETSVDRAAITRLTAALDELTGIKANLSTNDAVLAELLDLYQDATQPLPASNEDRIDYQETSA